MMSSLISRKQLNSPIQNVWQRDEDGRQLKPLFDPFLQACGCS